MASKVSYKQGLKSTYLGLLTKDPNALYFCTDTKELFRGDDLYSDGIRIVESSNALPMFETAADGILYFCKTDGNGYVLNETRSGWLHVIHGIDNETIGFNDAGLLSVKSIQMNSVVGLMEKLQEIEQQIVAGKGFTLSSEFIVDDDGGLSIKAIEQRKIIGLEDRLSSIEKSIVGGIRYCGAVETVDELPIDANVGDLYEVYSDSSEWCWNGEKWFEYGKTVETSGGINIDDIRELVKFVEYEISNKPDGTLVNYTDEEIRIMCPDNTIWNHQKPGNNGDPNRYYIGLKAYAPNGDVVSFKEDLSEIISDSTMYYFEGNDFAGIDEYGRKYSIVWLPVASYDENTDTWNYYGDNSSVKKYIGWHYSVEWYNANGMKVAADTIRINLANEDCYSNITPFYMSEIQSTLNSLEESYTWGDM